MKNINQALQSWFRACLAVSALLSNASAFSQTPQEAFRKLLEAARQNDGPAFVAQLTSESRQRFTESLTNRLLLHEAKSEFVNALNTRFGGGAGATQTFTNDLRVLVRDIANSELVSQKPEADGTVQLQVKVPGKSVGRAIDRQEDLAARMEGQDWRIALRIPPDSGATARRIAVAKQITGDVVAGKYKDRYSAIIALSNAWNRKEEVKP